MLTTRRMITPALAAMLLLALPPVTHAEADDDYGDEYRDGAYARVQAIDGGLTIRRAVDVEGAAAADDVYVNSPVFPGDTVLTSTAQRAEVQLAGGSLIRIDDRSELTFLALPNPYADFADNGVLQLAAGTIQLTVTLPDNGELRVDTPAATVYFLDDGDFRVEVSPRGATFVSARRGVAEVVGEGGSVLVRGGTRTEVVAGSLPADPYPFNTFASDAFDRWVERREEVYSATDRFEADTYSELPTEVRPYYRELNSHGDWAYVGDYGYVWRPTGVSSAWRPYYDGYWDYGPHGYFWVSHEPWGWAPYHYGRWNYLPRYGWCWVPGRVFSGAWVAWSWGSAHVGWAPLDFWGRPAYINTVHYGYYDPLCWTFVNYTNLHRRHYSRYAVRVDQVGVSVRTATVVRRAPRVPPSRLARSAESRERAVSLAADRPASRIRPTDRDARPTRSMRDAESSLAATARGPARRAAISGASGRSDTRTFPRRISSEDGRASALRGSGRSRPAAQSGGGDGAATDRRVRDLYRRMASPSTTQERPARPTPAAGADSTGRRETPARVTPQRGSSAQRGDAPPRARSSATAPQRGNSTGSRARGTESSGSSSERKQKDDGGKRQPGLSSARTPPSAMPSRPSRVAPERTRPSAATAPRSTAPRSSATAPRSTAPRSSATAPRSTAPRSSATAPRSGTTAPRARTAGRAPAPQAAPASPRPSTPRATAPRTSSRPAKAAPSSSKRDSGSASKSAPARRGGERRKR